ncbi:hypothetical protein B0H19DRAFT_1256527 [Mycena capillaripes]|nr:hypothetical protein B0H19DRAFT_1256527 [Mycena capillaripes]
MAPSTSTSTIPPNLGSTDESWKSQLVCLFGTFGFTLLYTLCCYLYNLAGWSTAANSGDVDRILLSYHKADRH